MEKEEYNENGDVSLEHRRKSDTVTSWERHGQTVLASLVLVLLTWVGYNVNENSKSIPVMSAEMTALKDQVKALVNSGANDRYRGQDAIRDFSNVSVKIERMGNSIDVFSREQAARGPRLKNMEEDIRELFKAIRNNSNGKSKK